MRGAIPPLPNTSSWRGAQLGTGTTLPFFTFYTELLKCPLLYITEVCTEFASALRKRVSADMSHDTYKIIVNLKGKVFPVPNQARRH
jgi:hypothetical protein